LWESLWNESEWPEALANPPAPPIPDRVKQGIHTTYINHATVLIQVGGLNILTDPIWSERASPVTFAGPKRIRPPGVAISDLPEIDLILISHNHYDHLDTETLKQLRQRQNKEPVIVSGLGNAALLRSIGYEQAIELDWRDSTPVENATVHFVECQHRSARGVFDQMRTLWGSFVVETSEGNIYFAGDTGYSPHFKEQGERFGSFALSIIPIGAYEPRWFMQDIHLNPKEAVQAHIDLNSNQSVGMHFGVFQLTWEPVNQPLVDLDTALRDAEIDAESFWALEPGQARTISR
jgi:L-ascorbate metabolism protein UlaG (beta-lactamase superfamily)